MRLEGKEYGHKKKKRKNRSVKKKKKKNNMLPHLRISDNSGFIAKKKQSVKLVD